MNRLENSLSGSALGMVSTRSFPAIIGVADTMIKSAGVVLVGIEKIGGGHCTAIARGRIADIRIAVDAGAQNALEFGPGQLVSSTVIPRPLPNMEVIFPLGSHLAREMNANRYGRVSQHSIGLIETRGFPPMVAAADAMLKSADVELTAFETIGDGLCTAIIRGPVADVVVAVEAGMAEVTRIGAEVNAVYVIPRPQEDLDRILPFASCMLEEEPQPLMLPLTIPQEEKEEELVELPDLDAIPVPKERTQG